MFTLGEFFAADWTFLPEIKALASGDTFIFGFFLNWILKVFSDGFSFLITSFEPTLIYLSLILTGKHFCGPADVTAAPGDLLQPPLATPARFTNLLFKNNFGLLTAAAVPFFADGLILSVFICFGFIIIVFLTIFWQLILFNFI